jgi:hypothetical protein
MNNLLAQIGPITNPFNTLSPGITSLTNASTQGQGLITILNNILRTAVVMAGIYVLFNFIIAGYQFISAGGEPKNVAKAWEKIWQSMLGLLIIAGSLVLAAIVGFLIFGDVTILIEPRIFAPQ